MNPDTPILDRLQAMPKAEVHVHLEGCFDAALLEQWAHKFGERLPRRRERLFYFEGLADGPACDFGGDNPSPTLMVPKSFRLPAAIGAARLCCPWRTPYNAVKQTRFALEMLASGGIDRLTRSAQANPAASPWSIAHDPLCAGDP